MLTQGDRQPFPHIHPYGQFRITSKLNLMSLDYERKPEYPKRTHGVTGRTTATQPKTSKVTHATVLPKLGL